MPKKDNRNTVGKSTDTPQKSDIPGGKDKQVGKGDQSHEGSMTGKK